MDPSFTDLPPQPKNEVKRSRKRKGAAGCSKPTVQPTYRQTQTDGDEPWIDRYSPSSQVGVSYVHEGFPC